VVVLQWCCIRVPVVLQWSSSGVPEVKERGENTNSTHPLHCALLFSATPASGLNAVCCSCSLSTRCRLAIACRNEEKALQKFVQKMGEDRSSLLCGALLLHSWCTFVPLLPYSWYTCGTLLYLSFLNTHLLSDVLLLLSPALHPLSTTSFLYF
jgi:hypothetical protein